MNNVKPKEVIFKSKSQDELSAGVNVLADAVKVTMGPGGQNVIIEQENAGPILTKDGVTVAKAIALSLPFQNMGVMTVKEAASKTADTAGDGTTTATVITQAIVNQGQKLVAAGHNPVKLRKGIMEASRSVLKILQETSQPIETDDEIVSIGTISANGDKQIGEFLAQAMHHVGRDGVITVDESRGFETSLDVVDGFELDRGFISPYFVTDQSKGIVEFRAPKILLANRRISAVQDIVAILESARRQSESLLIIADDVDGDALKVCVLNAMKGIVDVCVLRSPAFGTMRVEALNDLGMLFNTKVYTQGESLPADTSELGSCGTFTGFRNSSVFVGTQSNDSTEIQARLKNIIQSLQHPGLKHDEELYLRRRQATLSGGIAVIRVGGSTDLERRERKDRIDDAVCATRAAARGGIVDGGGFALLRAAQKCRADGSPSWMDDDETAGWHLLLDAVKTPVRQIAQNAGFVPEIVLESAKDPKNSLKGFNARTGEWVNMKESGIIDPLPVVESALSHATSAALNLLSVGCAIVGVREKNN